MAEGKLMKIALLGAAGYEYSSTEVRVECFPWNKLKNAPNLADFDVLILNLLSITGPGSLDAEAILNLLSVDTMLKVLSKDRGGPNGAIFVLGDPRFNIVEAPPEYQDHPDFKKRAEIPFLGWTGMEFKWDGRPGDTVECGGEATSGPFKLFVDKLGRWQ